MSTRLWIQLSAPFGAFRTFTAGWYRPTARFLTHSAAYGILLNLAGIESRLWEHEDGHRGKVPASLTRPGLPRARIALGIPEGHDPPSVHTIFQQLHNYPVGAQSGISQEWARGRKNNITPVRRELLRDISAVIVIEGDHYFLSAIEQGIRGAGQVERYGLPFVGDNNFLPDRLEVTDPISARWYHRVEIKGKIGGDTTRLTIRVDRTGMTETVSDLFSPTEYPSHEIHSNAWAEVGDV